MKNRLFFFVLVFVAFACSEPKTADLVIHNATIHTMDDLSTVADAVAIKDGKILEVGPEHQIMNAYRATEVVDAEKAVLYPGFIDAHAHFLGYSLQQRRVELVGTESFEEVIDRVRSHIEEFDSKWVLGRGWDQNDWAVKQFPTNDTLSVLFPDHFIVLTRVDGHAALVSQNVLELAGIDALTKIDGGSVVLEEGRPTGVLIDEATSLVKTIIPKPTNEEKASAMVEAQQNLFAVGLTSVVDAGLTVEEVKLIEELHQKDLLIRIYAMYSASPALMTDMRAHRIENEKLTARSIKVYADGALGSRGAKLLEPYKDDSSNAGLLITPRDSIAKWAKACYDAGFQLNVHCIGDGANRMVLEEMGKVLQEANDRRWRIEHAQVVHPEDREKFGRFNILPSMQPTHTTSDMYWVETRLGEERTQYAYTLKSLMVENGMIPLGTDFPVEDIDPINTFYAAVARMDSDGFPPGGFQPDEALNRLEALRGMTIWAAIANFEEELKGSIEPGKLADLVMLDRDLLTCPDDAILGTEVVKTWINGRLVYEK